MVGVWKLEARSNFAARISHEIPHCTFIDIDIIMNILIRLVMGHIALAISFHIMNPSLSHIFPDALLVICRIAAETDPVEIVSFPMKFGDSL